MPTIAAEDKLKSQDLSVIMPNDPQALSGKENVKSPSIAPIGTVHIMAGHPWEFYVRGRMPGSAPPSMVGVSLPSGAVMTEVGDGWTLIYWQPENDDIGQHLLTIRAMDDKHTNRLFDRDIVVEVHAVGSDWASRIMAPAGANPSGQGVSPVDSATSNIPSAPIDPVKEVSEVARLSSSRASYIGHAEGNAKVADKSTGLTATNARQAPKLAPIATHIISAGRALTVRVAPEHDSELPPIIHIDRLPPNASFDANEDGSRTFYWPTSDSDQGQHRFRFTVIHPDDASLKSSLDMTIIVGDPSKQFTIPADR